jgi:hypothetical protein
MGRQIREAMTASVTKVVWFELRLRLDPRIRERKILDL